MTAAVCMFELSGYRVSIHAIGDELRPVRVCCQVNNHGHVFMWTCHLIGLLCRVHDEAIKFY